MAAVPETIFSLNTTQTWANSERRRAVRRRLAYTPKLPEGSSGAGSIAGKQKEQQHKQNITTL
jgi:hypothetical protein